MAQAGAGEIRAGGRREEFRPEVSLLSIRGRYRSLDLVIVGYSLFSEGGDWRSIYLYFRDAQQKGRGIHLVDGRRPDGRKQLLAAAAFAPRIVVNALASLMRWPCLLLCLFRRDVFIYLHDTEYMLDRCHRSHPLRYRLIRRVLRRNPVLCVSRQAENLYRERYGSTRTHVVYECTRVTTLDAFTPGRLHILMAGSMDQRKGVPLFSQVAELAATRFPGWRFHWCGGSGSTADLHRSGRVSWHGWQPALHPFMERADIFFLSSLDDPCPLVALEALAAGKKCVVFRQTGVAELVEGLAGCAVYEDYSAQAALAAIREAASAPLDLERLREAVLEKTGDRQFASNLESAIGLERADVER